MIESGWKRGFVAVLIGTVLGIGGLAGQPAAQAAPSDGVYSEGGYSEGGYEGYGEGRGCRDCFSERRPCEAPAERRCGDCYDRQQQPRCGDCYERQQQPRCGDCYERQSLEEQAYDEEYQ
jgi:hypothetical protein